ncbi:exopolysaccharide biosynthesis polyprenyl glycosylphosphotransferase [Granulicatella balaenopterae]|uniref:Exopolysaccharide biosynthesis polyprenyl glycosylphosphotransferase n=1 Tax=Granulicatella balaenopterae TaxID=137733 RepID=A0A1H9K905_9LACT|nr:sugar transferase [Granulicatella balaenopterae]SEQ95417.1 exopolysaccharide biosynthesis polyprenyl glycosylphosphotransferase [Granulicatella balaenopterae]
MFEKEENGIFKNWMFLISDMLALQIALIIAYELNGSIGSISIDEHYVYISTGCAIISFLVVFFAENYKSIDKRGYFKEFVSVTYFTCIVFLIMISVFFVFKISAIFSRLFIGIWFIISWIMVYSFRVTIKEILKTTNKYHKCKKIMIVTNSKYAKAAKELAEESLDSNYKVAAIGFLDDCNKNIEGIDTTYSIDGIVEYVRTHLIDEVLISHVSYSGREELVEQLLSMGITVHYNLYNWKVNHPHATINTLGKLNVATACNNSISERNLFIKRLMDICGSIVGLIIGIPILMVVIPIIYINSPGNVFFVQKRVGKNGRIFNLYKLRSMYMDAEERKAELMKNNEMNGLMFKMENDPRITPIGHFIRKTSIDEIPQFVNVLKGDMSLVGTRPPTVDEYKQYELHHKSRLAMRPGITGMWQVAGRSEITDFEEVVRLDRSYIDNWNLGLDIKLLLKTVAVVFKSKGAK